MSRAVALIEEAFGLLSRGDAENRNRGRIRYPGGLFHYMAASLPARRAVGTKTYLSTRTGTHFLVTLFDAESGQILALLEADWLGRIRTGAASGVATKLLSRRDSQVAGVIGTGGQALTQIEALLEVRALESVRVFGRDSGRRRAFVELARQRARCDVSEAGSAREAVEGADIVTTITTAQEPVFDGAWLGAGTHVNAAGANMLQRKEVDLSTISRASCIVVDSVDQAMLESSALVDAVAAGATTWQSVKPLSDLVAERVEGRTSEADITVFFSQGIALEDVAVARYVYDAALEAGRGQHVAFGGSA